VPLARLESQVVFLALLERFANLRLTPEQSSWGDNLILHGLKSLPVAV
jgi:cytochrome P450